MSDQKHRSKTFIRSLILLHQNVKNVETLLKDKRMSIEEKNIIRGWLLLRKNRVTEVVELINGMSHSEDNLVNSQKNLLQGIVYNNLGEMDQAVDLLNSVPAVLKNFKLNPLLIIAYYNLFICYFNKGDRVKCDETLLLLEYIRPENIRHKIMYQQCLFMRFLLNKETEKAKKILIGLDKVKDKMSESMRIGHAYDKFNLSLANRDFKSCFKCLDEIKKCRSFQMSENFTYLKILLEHLVMDKPIYVYSQQFKTNHTFFLQLKFIQGLSQVDIKSAKSIWEILHVKEPDCYKSDFTVRDEFSLFSIALLKYRSYFSYEPLISKMERGSLNGNKEKILFYLLKECHFPLPKEFIHKVIWGREIESKDDVIKLKKLISRLRKNFKVVILFKNNCYSIPP